MKTFDEAELSKLGEELHKNGFCIVAGVFSPTEIAKITSLLPNLGERAGTRTLLDHEVGEKCANDERVRELVEFAIGRNAKPVRGILFDKTPETNWTLGWHQDTKIAVVEQKEVAGYSAWSIKEEVVHCRPPLHVLENSVAVRIHLDDCDASNGPLKVIPGSHRNGFCDVADDATAITLTCQSGDVILMKPLTVHGSTKSESPNHRRVIHIEFCGVNLDGGLRWACGP